MKTYYVYYKDGTLILCEYEVDPKDLDLLEIYLVKQVENWSNGIFEYV
jgi:hypothetical protein